MPCPDDSQIRAYANGTLTSSKDKWVKGHVSGCPLCAAKLMGPQTQLPPTRPPLAAQVDRETPRASQTLPKGAHVGRYIVQSELGEGGMGTVYVALDPSLDRRVALKLLHAADKDDSPKGSADHRLLREAQAMARLSHPNVVTVHDVGRHDGHVFVAMELVEGIDLKHWLLDHDDWRDVLGIFLGAGQGLVAAHAKGLLHRDFKPPNVLIGVDGRVRVGDFGIARIVDASEEQDEVTPETRQRLAAAVTRTGGMIGTFGYVAPEVLLGEESDARADQFSFGVSMFEAFYGARPFRGRTYRDYFASVMKGPPDAPPKETGAPGWLFKVVKRSLSLDAAARYPSMSDLLSALEPPKGLLGSLFKR